MDVSASSLKQTRLDHAESLDDDNDHSSGNSSINSSKSPGSSDLSSSGNPSSGSSTGSSSHTGSTTTGKFAALKEGIGKANVAVKCMGIFVVALLVGAGFIVGQLTYDFAFRTQDINFQQEFAYYAGVLARRSFTRLSEVEIKMSTQATATTLNAIQKGEEWPYVTFNTFEVRGQNMLRLTDAEAYLTAVFVAEDQRDQWELYSQENQGWVQTGLDARGENEEALPITGYIHTIDNEDRDPGPGPYVPVWQIAPAPVDPMRVNFNLNSDEIFSESLAFMIRHQVPVVTQALDSLLYQDGDDAQPRSCYMYPTRRTIDSDSDLVASCLNCFTWDTIFKDILHEDCPNGIVVVLSNECGQVYTYIVNHEEVLFVDEGDHHDPEFEDMLVAQNMYVDHGEESLDGLCPFHIDIYPSETFRAEFDGNEPYVYTAGVVALFGLAGVCFVLYATCVERRQKDQLESTLRVNAIVTSLFPKNILNRLLSEDGNAAGTEPTGLITAVIKAQENEDTTNAPNIPIADLFPSATVIFSDLVGFTAWSSAREPAQVFTLLETVYYNFDVIARKRRVFKVETIGDCYVAVCGLPDARKHHATVMAKFANDCMEKLYEVVRSLEIELGPDTAELSMRFGLHSGPVTAGVLRGEKSRFQLFGETVDMAAQMEHTGSKNRIHVSQATADLIILSGKEKWVKAREDKVHDEKKGDIQTYWVNVNVDSSVQSRLSSYMSSEFSSAGSSIGDAMEYVTAEFGQTPLVEIQGINQLNEKTSRIVEWMTELLSKSLKKIVAMRGKETTSVSDVAAFTTLHVGEGTVLDEVKEIIPLPGRATPYKVDPETVVLDQKIQSQLKDYVARIAGMYRDVPFHGFEHASHVTMSVGKLLSRIVDTQDIDFTAMSYKEDDNFRILHKTTYGITSDPLTQFALTFSALIHDVDHTGVPNSTLVKEMSPLAELYNNQSIAEQNSVDLAWDMFLEPQYKELQHCICQSQEEFQRFRQLVVNTVMATDIVDKELGALRKLRWVVAFDAMTKDEIPLDTVNRKATIVIEHLMQASDVAHTMQHWHVYQKWNERFFQECYMAYRNGRAEKDPSIGWYKGEIGFFDFYVIPLAKKLKDCGVFGVSSDEYLTYAQKNRDEWQRKGEYLVAEYLTRYEEQYGMDDDSDYSSGADLDEYELEMKD